MRGNFYKKIGNIIFVSIDIDGCPRLRLMVKNHVAQVIGNIPLPNDIAEQVRKLVRELSIFDAEVLSKIEPAVVELETLNSDFNQSIEAKNQCIEERDMATHKRILTANNIFDEVSYYSQLGQVI